jgi:hypothetical protein
VVKEVLAKGEEYSKLPFQHQHQHQLQFQLQHQHQLCGILPSPPSNQATKQSINQSATPTTASTTSTTQHQQQLTTRLDNTNNMT